MSHQPRKAGKLLAVGSPGTCMPPVLKIGDLVEIAEIRMFSGTNWRAALVVALRDNKFAARLLKGNFGEPEQTYIWLPLDQRGHMWR